MLKLKKSKEKKISQYKWSAAQEQMLKELVSKESLLVDSSLSNNSKIKNSLWQKVTKEVNLNFGVKLQWQQVKKKYHDSK